MTNALLKKAALEIRDECIELARVQEKTRQQKCAQILLAASGLAILKNKMGPKSSGDTNGY